MSFAALLIHEKAPLLGGVKYNMQFFTSIFTMNTDRLEFRKFMIEVLKDEQLLEKFVTSDDEAIADLVKESGFVFNGSIRAALRDIFEIIKNEVYVCEPHR